MSNNALTIEKVKFKMKKILYLLTPYNLVDVARIRGLIEQTGYLPTADGLSARFEFQDSTGTTYAAIIEDRDTMMEFATDKHLLRPILSDKSFKGMYLLQHVLDKLAEEFKTNASLIYLSLIHNVGTALSISTGPIHLFDFVLTYKSDIEEYTLLHKPTNLSVSISPKSEFNKREYVIEEFLRQYHTAINRLMNMDELRLDAAEHAVLFLSSLGFSKLMNINPNDPTLTYKSSTLLLSISDPNSIKVTYKCGMIRLYIDGRFIKDPGEFALLMMHANSLSNQ